MTARIAICLLRSDRAVPNLRSFSKLPLGVLTSQYLPLTVKWGKWVVGGLIDRTSLRWFLTGAHCAL